VQDTTEVIHVALLLEPLDSVERLMFASYR